MHVAEFANILFVRVHTDAGLVGLGETYYTPRSTTSFIHEVGAPMLLGENPLDVEWHWRRLYDATHVYGNRGNEMRAISALEVALWDLLGQHAGLADTCNLPFVAHDCTGPVTFLASIHLSVHCPNALIQESVRAYYRGFYQNLITVQPRIEDGYVYPPEGPGLGAALRPELFARPDITVRESAP